MINVILPTYNEAENIVPMVFMLSNTFDNMNVPYKIIVIDDNSPDGTSKIVKSLGNPSVKVIDRPAKLGLGSAYLDGLKECTYEYTILMDSDMQHDPSSIPLMYKTITSNGKYDIVTGTRYAKNGMVCDWPFLRKFLSRVSINLARYVLGLNCSDLTGSFRCYKTSVLRELVSKVKNKNFGFQMEVMARAELSGKKVAEVPIIFYDRIAGESKLDLKEMTKFVKTLADLYITL